MSRRRPVLLVTLLTMGVVAACSSGGSTAASPAADKAAAVKVNLRQPDFPTGWTSAPHQASPEETTTLRQLTQCVGIADLAGHTTATDRSPDFSAGQATTANSLVTFVKTDGDASRDLGAFQSGKAPDCFKQAVLALVQQQAPGAVPANLEVHQLQFPTLKDGTAAYQASFTVAVAGTNLPVYADFVYFRAGRAEVAMVTTNAGSPLDPKLEQDLASKMARRA